MKPLAIAALSFGLLVSLTPDKGFAESSDAPTVVYFGARADASPLSYREGDDWNGYDEWNGYTVELCKRLFRTYQNIKTGQKLKLQFRPIRASDRFELLRNGEIEAICGATTVTIERMQAHRFTLLTFVSGASVMKLKETRIQKLKAPTEQPEKVKVAVVKGTTTEDRIHALLGDSVKMIEAQTHGEAFDALRNGEVSFYFGDRVMLRERLRKTEDFDEFLLAPGFLSYEPYAIAVRKENEDLYLAANQTLAGLYRDEATMREIYARWFGEAAMSDLLASLFELMKIPEGQ